MSHVKSTHRKQPLVLAGAGISAAILIIAVLSTVPQKPTTHSVSLTWNAPAATGGVPIIGYNVYRSTTAGGPYVPLALNVDTTAYKDALISGGRTYFYVVTSLDSKGRESKYSEELRVSIP